MFGPEAARLRGSKYSRRGRRLLADALRRLIVAKIPVEGASDHGVSEALYLRDRDDNGVSSIGTGRKSNSRSGPTAACRCTLTRSTCTTCWPNSIARRLSRVARPQRSVKRCAAEPGPLQSQSLERPRISAAPAARCAASGARAKNYAIALATARRASTPTRCARYSGLA